MNTLPPEVEKRFNEYYTCSCCGEVKLDDIDPEDVKSFLADELAREQERIVEVLRELASDPPLESNERRRGFQEAIDQALSLISKPAETNQQENSYSTMYTATQEQLSSEGTLTQERWDEATSF